MAAHKVTNKVANIINKHYNKHVRSTAVRRWGA